MQIIVPKVQRNLEIELEKPMNEMQAKKTEAFEVNANNDNKL